MPAAPPELLVLDPVFERSPAQVPLDRETLLARFDGIRQFARGGRRAPHKSLLLLNALACLKHDRQTEIRFNATKEVVKPLLRSYGPWASGALVTAQFPASSTAALPQNARQLSRRSRSTSIAQAPDRG